jgi:hypothetical protein
VAGTEAEGGVIRPPQFTVEDAQRAHDEWGCNCGPSALAAIVGLTLDQVRQHMGDFERKGYTNPTLMLDALHSVYAAGLILGWRNVSKRSGVLPGCDWPQYGLARIQWEGPWTAPGVPMRARYRHTHWVGAAQVPHRGIGIFDINCINNVSGWVAVSEWRQTVVPWILKECVPRAFGAWHITHSIEVDGRAA